MAIKNIREITKTGETKVCHPRHQWDKVFSKSNLLFDFRFGYSISQKSRVTVNRLIGPGNF